MVRHAAADTVEVRVRYDPGAVEVTVTGDGRGPGRSRGVGHGIRGMRERAEAIGGSLEAGVGEGGGFRVRAHLPTED